MYRATTPTFTFDLPCDMKVEEIDNLIISFAQNGKVLFEKTKDDCIINSIKKQIIITLTQEETKRFSHKMKAQVQMRIRFLNGKVQASEVGEFPVHRVFNETPTLTPSN